MENQLTEMMVKVMDKLSSIESEMTSMKSEMAGLKTEMNTRFDAVDTRLDAVESKLTGVGQHFEELSKNIQVKDNLTKELKYITHKVNALDRELFMRTNPQ
ncbi:hypothetical protein [Sporosarcina sp. SAFN-015]|uniref:hypothetical protein n=1 Tax=Sporosarcina sp. SAFN-015 TaxID=3387274 RepID=UPI003F8106C5